MADSVIRSGANYLSTFVLLVKDYVAFLRWRSVPLLTGVVAARLLYPLPFAIMAAAAYAMLAGHDSSVISVQGREFVVSVDDAFLYSLLLAAAVLIFNYWISRVALDANTTWQESLLWHAINRLPVVARWDAETALPMPMAGAGRIGSFLTSMVRSGSLIGRIVSIGLPDLGIVIGTLLFLLWLDPLSVSALVGLAVLMLPVYSWAMRRLVGMREGIARDRQQQRAALQNVLEKSVLARPERRVDVSELSPEEKSEFSAGYSIVNDQLKGLNLIGLVVGFQVFLSIAMIYLVSGGSLAALLKDKVLLFVVLIFMMRSALSLTLLISRLSRSYTSLAILRAFFHPRRKRVHREPNMPAGAVFAIARKRGERHYLCKGKPVFVVMPKATYAYQLLPLSNALQIVDMPKPAAPRHIVFLDAEQLESLLAGTPPQAPAMRIEIADKASTLQLPVGHHALYPKAMEVVALSIDAWDLLQRKGEAKTFCSDRIAFIVVAAPKRPKALEKDALLVVSDGVDILAAGPFGKTWESSAEEAFQRAAKKDVRIDLDDEEEFT